MSANVDPRADDGRPDPRLVAALEADDGSPARRGEVLAALATARVFLALAARPVAGAPSRSTADMALVALVAPTGERALPAFADGRLVQRWRPEARPVPVTGAQACRAAVDDGAAALLLEPGGAAVAVTGAGLAELAAGRVPVAGVGLSTRSAAVELTPGAPVSPALLAALARALGPEPVSAARLLAGPDGPVVGVVSDEGPAALAALAERVRLRLGADLPPGGLDLAAVAPDGPGQPVPLARAQGRWWRRRP